jgi:fatty acid desaturase
VRRGTAKPPVARRSVGTAVVLMAVGGVLAFGIHAPAVVEEYVDLLDLGLILIWSGLLLLVMQVVMHRPRRTSPRRTTWDDRTNQWYEQDVHRPGYADETRQLPTVRDGRRR